MSKWYDATLQAVKEIVQDNNSPFLTYKEIKEKKLKDIILNSGTKGKTPENSLGLYLQNIRDKGLLKFIDNRGLYFFIDNKLDELFIGKEVVNDKNDDILYNVDTDEIIYQTKIRKGQNTLRKRILENYNKQCAFCDIKEETLLITSHIFRWCDDKNGNYRGKLDNVICMCEMHDALFELGYFTINASYEIVNNYKGKDEIIKAIINTSAFKIPLKFPPNLFCLKKHHIRIKLK